MQASTGDDGARSRNWLRLVLAPVLVALLVIGLQAFRKPHRAPLLDEFYYLTIARDLALHGVYTDGTFKRGPFMTGPGPASFGDEDPRWAKPGRFFAPAYPVLAWAVGRLDPRLAASIRCHVRYVAEPEQARNCPTRFTSLIAVNAVLWALAMLAVFHMGLLLGQGQLMGWLAMLIALATGEPGFYAHTYLSETATVPAFCCVMLFAMRALAGHGRRDAALCGAALGAAALSRPAYIYLYYALVPVLLALSLVARRRWPSLPTPALVGIFALAALVVVLPWLVRNVIRFGDPTLSRGYAEVILMQRLSYNRMSWGEWGVAWIYWLPDFGDEVAKRLFAPHLWERLGWSHPANYYVDGGSGAFRKGILAEAGSEAAVLPLLYRKYLLGDMLKHIVVTFPLTMRGLGVAKYLSVAGVLCMWPVARRLSAQGQGPVFLALLLPPLLMAGLHGFVSINIERYNLPMIAVYAVVVALAIKFGWQRAAARQP